MTGAVMSPFTAHLVLRGLKTLNLRMDRHSRTACSLAQMLEGHPAVQRVYYPGLARSKQHDLARKQMMIFGGMIAFDLTGGGNAGIQLMNSLRLIRRAVSLGDAESLIQHPASMTHSTYSAAEFEAYGINQALVRLSVGLEDEADLVQDSLAALGQLA